MLIFQLNSTVCQKLPQLRPGLEETRTEDLVHCVVQMVVDLRNKLCEIARDVGKNCSSKQFLKEMANEILDCYNFFPDKVFKYVNSVMVEQENQNSDLNSRFKAVQSQLLDFQEHRTFQENLVQERDTEIGEIRHQLETVQNQLNDVQQHRTFQQNLVQERDTEIATMQQHLNEVRNQLLIFHQQQEPSLLSDSSNDVTLEIATVQQPNGQDLFANANPMQAIYGMANSMFNNNERIAMNVQDE